jgi:hypothetical protein
LPRIASFSVPVSFSPSTSPGLERLAVQLDVQVERVLVIDDAGLHGGEQVPAGALAAAAAEGALLGAADLGALGGAPGPGLAGELVADGGVDLVLAGVPGGLDDVDPSASVALDDLAGGAAALLVRIPTSTCGQIFPRNLNSTNDGVS